MEQQKIHGNGKWKNFYFMDMLNIFGNGNQNFFLDGCAKNLRKQRAGELFFCLEQ